MYQFFAVLVFPVLISCSVKLFTLLPRFSLVMPEVVQQIPHDIPESPIAYRKIYTEKKSREDYHHGSAVDFLLAGPSDAPGLSSDFVGILLKSLPEPFGLSQGAAVVILPNTAVFSHFALDPVERFAALRWKSSHPKSGRGGGI